MITKSKYMLLQTKGLKCIIEPEWANIKAFTNVLVSSLILVFHDKDFCIAVFLSDTNSSLSKKMRLVDYDDEHVYAIHIFYGCKVEKLFSC